MIHPASQNPRQDYELLNPFASHTEQPVAEGAIPEQVVPQEVLSETVGDTEKKPNWFNRNRFNLSLGLFVGGVALTAALNPLHELKDEAAHVGPWVIGGLATTETMWIGGMAMMAKGSGKEIGNPLKLRGRWDEVSEAIASNSTFRTGLNINALGAYGSAAVVGTAATQLPIQTWPGAAALVAADMASTYVARKGLFSEIEEARTAEKAKKVTVRHATIDDMDRLADIDLALFEKAYGEEKPTKESIVEMFTKRFENAQGWMFVAEMNGQVEGFVTAFRTDKPADEFTSWEDSTNDGTLDGRVDPNGKYVYVANMTIMSNAVANGAEDMLLANLFANSIEAGVDYGYFVARVPHFKRWLQNQAKKPGYIEKSIQERAEEYYALTIKRDGKEVPYDPQLRMYKGLGYHLEQLVPDAFEDDASLNYGVVCKADIPPSGMLKKVKPIRQAMAFGLRQVAKNPKLLNKVF